MYSLISGGLNSLYNFVSPFVAEEALGQGSGSSILHLRPKQQRVFGADVELSTGQRQLGAHDPGSSEFVGTETERQAALRQRPVEEFAQGGFTSSDTGRLREIEHEMATEQARVEAHAEAVTVEELAERPMQVSSTAPVTEDVSLPWVDPDAPVVTRGYSGGREETFFGDDPDQMPSFEDPALDEPLADPTWEAQQVADIDAVHEGFRGGRVVEPPAPGEEMPIAGVEVVVEPDLPPLDMVRVGLSTPGGTSVSEMPYGGGFLGGEMRRAKLSRWSESYQTALDKSHAEFSKGGEMGHQYTRYGEGTAGGPDEFGIEEEDFPEPSRMEGQMVDEPSFEPSFADEFEADLAGGAEVDPETKAVMDMLQSGRTGGAFDAAPPRIGSEEYGRVLASREIRLATDMGIEEPAYTVSDYPSGRIAHAGASASNELMEPLLGEPPVVAEADGMVDSLVAWAGYLGDALGGWEAVATGGLSLVFGFVGNWLIDLGEKQDLRKMQKSHTGDMSDDYVARGLDSMDEIYKYYPGFLHMRIPADGTTIYSFPAWPVHWAPGGYVEEFRLISKRPYIYDMISDDSRMIVGFKDLTGFYREVNVSVLSNPFVLLKDSDTSGRWRRTRLRDPALSEEQIKKYPGGYSTWTRRQVQEWMPFATTDDGEMVRLHYYPQLSVGTRVYLIQEHQVGEIAQRPVAGKEPRYYIKKANSSYVYKDIWDILVAVPKPYEQLVADRKTALDNTQRELAQLLHEKDVPVSAWQGVMETAASLGYMSREKWPTGFNPTTLVGRASKNPSKLNWDYFAAEQAFLPYHEEGGYGRVLRGGPKTKQLHIRGTGPEALLPWEEKETLGVKDLKEKRRIWTEAFRTEMAKETFDPHQGLVKEHGKWVPKNWAWDWVLGEYVDNITHLPVGVSKEEPPTESEPSDEEPLSDDEPFVSRAPPAYQPVQGDIDPFTLKVGQYYVTKRPPYIGQMLMVTKIVDHELLRGIDGRHRTITANSLIEHEFKEKYTMPLLKAVDWVTGREGFDPKIWAAMLALGQPDQVTLVQPGDPEYPVVHTTRAMQRRYLKYPWMTIGVGKSPDPARGPWVMYNLGLLDRQWAVKKPYRLWHTKKHLGDMFETAQKEWDLAHPVKVKPVTVAGVTVSAPVKEAVTAPTRRRLPGDDDGRTLIQWPRWWENFDREEHREMYRIDWLTANHICRNLCERKGWAFTRKDLDRVLKNDPGTHQYTQHLWNDPPRATFVELHKLPNGRFAPRETDAFRRGFFPDSDHREGDVIQSQITTSQWARYSFTGIATNRRMATPWYWWQTLPNKTMEPLLRVPKKVKGFLSFKIDTTMDEVMYSRGERQMNENNIPGYLWVRAMVRLELAQHKPAREDHLFNEFLDFALKPESGLAFVDPFEFTEDALKYRFYQLSQCQDFLMSRAMRWHRDFAWWKYPVAGLPEAQSEQHAYYQSITDAMDDFQPDYDLDSFDPDNPPLHSGMNVDAMFEELETKLQALTKVMRVKFKKDITTMKNLGRHGDVRMPDELRESIERQLRREVSMSPVPEKTTRPAGGFHCQICGWGWSHATASDFAKHISSDLHQLNWQMEELKGGKEVVLTEHTCELSTWKVPDDRAYRTIPFYKNLRPGINKYPDGEFKCHVCHQSWGAHTPFRRHAGTALHQKNANLYLQIYKESARPGAARKAFGKPHVWAPYSQLRVTDYDADGSLRRPEVEGPDGVPRESYPPLDADALLRLRVAAGDIPPPPPIPVAAARRSTRLKMAAIGVTAEPITDWAPGDPTGVKGSVRTSNIIGRAPLARSLPEPVSDSDTESEEPEVAVKEEIDTSPIDLTLFPDDVTSEEEGSVSPPPSRPSRGGLRVDYAMSALEEAGGWPADWGDYDSAEDAPAEEDEKRPEPPGKKRKHPAPEASPVDMEDMLEPEENVLEIDPPDDQEIEFDIPEPQMFGEFPQLPPSPPGSPHGSVGVAVLELPKGPGLGSFMVPVTVALVFFIIASQL